MIRFTHLFDEPHLLLDPYSEKLWMYPKQEFRLVAGFECPTCTNVLWALFLTDKVVDVRPYEEVRTVLKDNDGGYRYIRTGLLTKRSSLYDHAVLSDGDTVSSQMIWLKEHFERMPGDEKSSVCKYRARFSMRSDIPLKEALLWTRPHDSFTFKTDDMDQVKQGIQNYQPAMARFTPVSDFVGKLPDLWLLARDMDTWYLANCLNKWIKKV